MNEGAFFTFYESYDSLYMLSILSELKCCRLLPSCFHPSSSVMHPYAYA